MPKLEISYQNIPKPEAIHKQSYRPPRHVYFGKRDPETGMMEEEPKYVHQDYPRMLYKLDKDVIIADVVNNDSECDAKLKDGWAKNPSEFGYYTAPSFEQHLAMEAKERAESVEDDELTKVRAEYEAKFGKRPHHKKSLETLKAEIEA